MKVKMKNLIKNKKIIIMIAVTLVIIISVVLFQLLKEDDIKIKDNIAFEYGEIPSQNLVDYLDFDTLDTNKKNDILNNAILNTVFENKGDLQYPSIGEYKGTINYKGKTTSFVFYIKDTTAPTMINFQPYQFTYIDLVPAYAEIYQASDLSNCVITIDDSSINYGVTGSYEATVKAVDDHSNTFQIKITVLVKEPTLELISSKDITLTVDDTSNVQVNVKGKETQAIFTSSDENIIRVDENGNITAISSGNANITIKANGKEEIVNITVNAKPVVNSGSGSTSSGSSSGSSTSGNTGNSSGSNVSGGSSTGGGESTPSNTCTQRYPAIDNKYFDTYEEAKQYFRETYGALGAGTHNNFGYGTDSCGRYYISSINSY